MGKPNIVIACARGAESFTAKHRRRLARVGNIRYLASLTPMPPSDFVKEFSDADIGAITPRVIPREHSALFTQLTRLKALAIPTTGHEWLHLPTGARRRLLVCHVPGFCGDSAAEFTWGLILCLSKKIRAANNQMRTGRKTPTHLRGFELKGKTLGVLGMGDIGGRVASIGKAFGMRVLSCDTNRNACAGTVRTDLPSLLRQSDIVTLHIPLNSGTRGLISRRALARMRADTLLINTARPDIVDMAAALESLDENKLGGYAFDCGHYRPAELGRIIRHSKVLAVPHISWYTDEAVRRELDMWVEEIIALARNRPGLLLNERALA